MVKHARVRAPQLVGRGGWINTGDQELSLAALRGRIVILDFWTFCCVNCLHALDELHELEERHRDTVVIVGVHSPKFTHEAEHRAVLDAVERYGVGHPVLDDPERVTWKQYAVRAWPTLAVIDPEGYVVAQYAGEGHAPAIQRLVEELEVQHEAKGTLRRGDAPYVPPRPEPTALRFPGKGVLLPSGTFLVSDTTRHQLVELAADGESPVRRIGSGRRGFTDGPAGSAEFSEPQGLALLADGSVVVADTVNHALRRYEPATGDVTTLAGTGRQGRPGGPTRGAARAVDLSSPWDVALWNGRVWIAMAGVHQLWAYDPRDGSVTVTAGTGNEGLVDGPGPEAWFAQPSGLSATEDRLWVADSETSALRWVDLGGTVRTAVGTGLFDFGYRDGPAARALLQHPLGVTALPDGSVAVADTYNHALRRYEPPTGEVSTLATDLREPSAAVVVGGDILVVESARHRLTRLRLPQEVLGARGGGVRRETTEAAPGTLRLEVAFRAPAGQKLDLRYGPATRLVVSATPPGLLRAGAGADTGLSRSLDLDPSVPGGVLHVSATAASCDDDPDLPYPACHVHQEDWEIPVRVVEGAADRLALVLAGVGPV
ncbi:redoxin domain-containing protein [Streptomyces parvulus]|uniref:NHL domain-containing thioredoxin family protein n=1 Tax=Streptomyces parvulus TaxID=146923 RepID=UPI001E29B8EE|nr:NHL domain-containing thioredoxin family protein [Streptomyces parvulus]MCC9155455.1 redoxin domain-containing protein [Streptomyces parvulus]MCE7687709.1 redoxin domain-containing protein [Streptomyces parvulus]